MTKNDNTSITTEKKDAETMKKIRMAVENGYDVSVKRSGKKGGLKIVKFKPQILDTTN